MYLVNIFIILFSSLLVNAQNGQKKLFCYYDSSSSLREGTQRFNLSDLDLAAQFCTHLVYGFIGIRPSSLQAHSLNPDLDIDKRYFAEVLALKQKHPNLKVLLGVGGDKDPVDANTYLNLLKNEVSYGAFVNSIEPIINTYGFDGLDLAFQFPKNKPRKVHSEIGMIWKKFKKLFTGNFIVDPDADQHKKIFTGFVNVLREMLGNRLLMLTVLPNVNSTWYFDVPSLSDQVDYVNLAAFDFLTPTRNPDEADFTAPLYKPDGQNRLPHYNVDAQVSYWRDQKFPISKLILGIATYGRAWRLTPDSGSSGLPVVAATDGPAVVGSQNNQDGIMSWPQICAQFPNPLNRHLQGAEAPISRASDPSKKYGIYAFRPADADGNHGLWISYDDPEVSVNKANYVKSENLGGVSLFDLSFDDFRGYCTGDKYPILRAVKYRLQFD